MTGGIRELKAVNIQPDPVVIEFLEDALADAKAGKTTGVLIVAQDREGGASYAITGIKNRFTVMGFLYHALFRLQSDTSPNEN
jgi:hypothetical protein